MANPYFNWPENVNRFVPLDTARAEDVNYALDELSSGLDQVGADIGASIKVAITSVDQTITAGPVARADKLIAFDGDGNVTVTADTVTSIAVNAAAAEADAATASAQAGIATTKAAEAAASAASIDPATIAAKTTGPASAIDNTLPRFDGTTGKLLQGSGVVVDDSGNVGIGVTDPASKLDVRNSDIRLSTNSARSTPYRITRTDTGSANGLAAISMFGSGANGYLGNITLSTASADFFDAPMVERMRIDSSGTTTFVSAAFGYGAGAGITPSQQTTNKGTTVVANKPSGLITTHAATLNANSKISFIVTNSFVTVADTVSLNVVGGTGDVTAYLAYAFPYAGGFYITLWNTSASNLSDAVQIKFNVIKGSNT